MDREKKSHYNSRVSLHEALTKNYPINVISLNPVWVALFSKGTPSQFTCSSSKASAKIEEVFIELFVGLSVRWS